jgi:hypothetical protein
LVATLVEGGYQVLTVLAPLEALDIQVIFWLDRLIELEILNSYHKSFRVVSGVINFDQFFGLTREDPRIIR